jgi:hypothetical protein
MILEVDMVDDEVDHSNDVKADLKAIHFFTISWIPDIYILKSILNFPNKK